jgi:BirA family biotin operon repressor/biotin-[acetyl-CoA-carboxylase] ligase
VIVQADLHTAIFGRDIMFYQTIDSTNRIAKEQAEAGAREGMVVIAEEQTAGKGRLGRAWFSPAGSNILCSIILYPGMAPSEAFKLTMLASVAVVNAIRNVCGQAARIKWPNDVYIGSRKVCGVLTEFMADHSALAYVVIGIGLNVNFDPSRYPEIMETATSLQAACGRPISRPTLFRALLQEMERLYGELHTNGGRTLQEAWKQHSMVLDQEVDIISGHEILTGVVKRISDEGHLILLDNDGAIHNIICGDLSLRVKSRAL